MYVEFFGDGSIYPCCLAFIKRLCIGNVYSSAYEEAWNSDIAVRFRAELLNGDMSQCDQARCLKTYVARRFIGGIIDPGQSFAEKMPLPKVVKFSHDRECNLYCVICRDSVHRNNPEQLIDLDSKIERIFLPMLQNASAAILSGDGDPFASRHYRKLMSAIVKRYPDIFLHLHTNGLLCTEKNCRDLGIDRNIHTVCVTVNGATQAIYESIMRGGSFDKAMEALNWLSYQRKMGFIKRILIFFVVSSLNFRQMPAMARIAADRGSEVYFWEYRERATYLKNSQAYSEMAIFEAGHPDHEEFIDICSNPILKQNHCHAYPAIGRHIWPDFAKRTMTDLPYDAF